MIESKNYNFSQGFLSLLALLVALAIIILILSIYFRFNKIIFNNSQSGQPEQFSPQDQIEKAKEAKDLLEFQQRSIDVLDKEF